MRDQPKGFRMKRSIVAALALGLVLSSLAAPSLAAKKKKAPKPVATTFYFHGNEVVGETESMAVTADQSLSMSREKPAGGDPKSKQIVNGVVTPNHQCSGNNYFPNFMGTLAGTVSGDMKVTFHTISSPGSVIVRVWPDVPTSGLCTSTAAGTMDYVKPAGEVTVPLANGTGKVEAVLKNLKFKALGSMTIQISPATLPPTADRYIFPPSFARVLYDTPQFDSKVEFKCIPAKGKSC